MSIRVMSHVWEHSRHKGGDLLLLLAIADHADDQGQAFPSIKRLAQKTRMTERNVQLVIKRLTHSRELVIHAGEGPHGCHLFELRLLGTCPCHDGGEKISPEKSSGVKKLRGEKSGKNLPKISPKPSLDPSEELKPKDPPLPPKGEPGGIRGNLPAPEEEKKPRPQPSYPPGFLQFWAIYPPARRASKPSCLKLWYKADLEPRTEEVCAKVEGLKQTVWQGKEPHFIPMTLTWLNQGRYDDDPITPTAPPVIWAWARDMEEHPYAAK